MNIERMNVEPVIPTATSSLFIEDNGTLKIQLFEIVNGQATGKLLIATFTRRVDLLTFLADNVRVIGNQLAQEEINREQRILQETQEAVMRQEADVENRKKVWKTTTRKYSSELAKNKKITKKKGKK